MGSEASEAGRPRHDHGRQQNPLSTTGAVVAATLLVTVAFVPAATPTAEATDLSGDACVPADDPYDMGLVLDRSGSMAGTPLQEAKEGSVRLLQNLTHNDQSGLVSYADDARLDDPLSFDHGSTAEAVADLQSGGNTATGSAIDLSHQDLQDRGRSSGNQTMVLLTDGITNEGPDPVAEADEAKSDGITIYAIGVGSSINEQDLRDIASDPVEEHFFHAASAEEVVGVFENLTANLTAPTPWTGEAYGAGADTLSQDPYTEAHVAETPHTTESPGEANAAEVARDVGPYTVAFATADAAVDGTSDPDNVTATSTSRITDLRVDGPDGRLLQADAVTTQAHAWSSPTDEATSDDGTHLAGLTVQGTAVAEGVPPDTEIALPGVGTLTLNEHVRTQEGDNVTIQVNAVHLEVDDGDRTGDVVVGSAYAAAACSVETSFDDAEAGAEAVSIDTVDEDVDAGPAAVNPGGCANATVAASATGCSEGDVAASGTGDANATGADCTTTSSCVAASGTGEAANAGGDCQASACVAASGTDDARNAEGNCDEGSTCVAASGTGNPRNSGDDCDDGSTCVAVSGDGNARNSADYCDDESSCVAATPTGEATNAQDQCDDQSVCVALSGDGDARNSADDCIDHSLCVAASGTGDAVNSKDECDNETICVAASGTGSTTNAKDDCADLSTCVAASGTGDATNAEQDFCQDQNVCVAASGTGDANGDLEVTPSDPSDPATLHCTVAFDCVVANTHHGGEAGLLAVSLVGDTSAKTGLAASVDGRTRTGIGVAVSGSDDASTGIGVAVSLIDDAEVGTGAAASPVDDADAGTGVAVSGTDDAEAERGVAVSATDDAYTNQGVAVGGCSGLEVEGGSADVDVDSPSPVCPDPEDLLP